MVTDQDMEDVRKKVGEIMKRTGAIEDLLYGMPYDGEGVEKRKKKIEEMITKEPLVNPDWGNNKDTRKRKIE